MTERVHSRLGFDHVETSALVRQMNDLLADYQVHFHKLQAYHWAVTGPDFFELHEHFGTMYEHALKHIDQIAERIRVFGKNPPATMRELLKVSELPEADVTYTSDQMGRDILKDLDKLIGRVLDVSSFSAKIGDIGTAHEMGKLMSVLEHDHWKLDSWLRRKKPLINAVNESK